MPDPVQPWLEAFLANHGAVAGTVHSVDPEAPTRRLVLRASVNIPPPVLEVIGTIPKGKGMAGLAWERMEPVTTCNLQDDETGDVRPGAKAVDAQAAVALPIERAGTMLAVVGLAYAGERTLTTGELERLKTQAAGVPV